ncbi:MAG: SAM-dependent methyltransferase, partial [Rhodocyclaceae bacterium]|nr:SAM-dependent methyltransferase [Rhodocyclaceae bacterium]
MAGTLHLIPVFLGEDASLDGLPPESLKAVACLDRFIVENAKTARNMLKRMGHPGPLRDLHIDVLATPPDPLQIRQLLAPLLAGESAGLMSEAGCPGVADPGALVVRLAHASGIPVRPHVGPSSLLLALMASGLDGQRFTFHGYLPIKEPERSRCIKELETQSATMNQTQLFIEAPYRNDAMLAALLAACRPETRICVATDLTTDR